MGYGSLSAADYFDDISYPNGGLDPKVYTFKFGRLGWGGVTGSSLYANVKPLGSLAVTPGTYPPDKNSFLGATSPICTGLTGSALVQCVAWSAIQGTGAGLTPWLDASDANYRPVDIRTTVPSGQYILDNVPSGTAYSFNIPFENLFSSAGNYSNLAKLDESFSLANKYVFYNNTQHTGLHAGMGGRMLGYDSVGMRYGLAEWNNTVGEKWTGNSYTLMTGQSISTALGLFEGTITPAYPLNSGLDLAPTITSGPTDSLCDPGDGTYNVTITWTTDYPATSMVKYEGVFCGQYPFITYNDTVLQTSHSVTLSLPGLFPGDGYAYIVASYDCVANKVESPHSGTIEIPFVVPACSTSIVCTDTDGDTYNKEGGACGSIDCNDNNASIYPGAAEVCNGIDDDCTGVADDGITPSTEVCDGIDNDCDGSIDEGITDCVCGHVVCTPSPEVCDGIDNDCDGEVDDGIIETCGIGACSVVVCCVNIINCCTPGMPSPETCNGIDDDCNGAVDDGIPSTPTSCGVGACASTGTTTCVGGVPGDTCVPGTSSPEVCDGIDNDCNGLIDDIPSTPTTCGVGACSSTGTLCCGGEICLDSCVPGTPGTEGPSGDATCSDGVDNDCDGLTDVADPDCVSDYDVMGFRCSHGTSVGGTTTITVVIKNQGTIDTGALLTVSGMQSGTPIPITTGLSVSDPVGGGRTTYTFSYIPVTTGNILWSIALVDGDPDFDNGLCTTIVK